ncbi:MAG: 16S rRNA (uracil(1498)-N(3))-methyltransferase [Acidobacteriota bacterium]
MSRTLLAMAGHRFFVPAEKIHSETALIEGDEAHHLRRVLRLAVGDEVRVFDSSGREWRAVIEQTSIQQVILRLLEPFDNEVESPIAITLAQGLIKGERFELVLQKAVELGISALQPFTSRYTDVQLSEARAEKRLERWQRIVLEATKQSGRRRLMSILPPLSWAELIRQINRPALLFAEQGGHSLTSISDQLKTLQPTAITAIVGSEGGWSREELAQAEAAGFHLVTLGPRILRTETAGIMAAVLLQYLYGDLGEIS